MQWSNPWVGHAASHDKCIIQMVPKIIILKSKRSSTFIPLVNPLGNVVIHILKKSEKLYHIKNKSCWEVWSYIFQDSNVFVCGYCCLINGLNEPHTVIDYLFCRSSDLQNGMLLRIHFQVCLVQKLLMFCFPQFRKWSSLLVSAIHLLSISN